MKIKIINGQIVRSEISEQDLEWERKEMISLRKRLKKAGLKSSYPRIPIEASYPESN